MTGKTIAEIKKGETASFSKTVSESDIYLFAGVTGDLNPAHIDEEYAKGTFFKTRIAHGSLLAGFISTVMGMILPGPGTVYIRQELDFLAPARIGDTVTAMVEVLELDEAKNRVRLRTFCRNQDEVLLVDGMATVSPPKAPKR
jgi:3-hydroxybutyryl-CoA dehydratase